MSLDRYLRVYQTWILLSRAPNKDTNPSVQHACPSSMAPTPLDLRHRVQMARVEKGLSIEELSKRVVCEAETLAAFERGDEVLSSDLQQSLRNVLSLDVGNRKKTSC